jgi:hypothetical protein
MNAAVLPLQRGPGQKWLEFLFGLFTTLTEAAAAYRAAKA